MIGVTIDLNFDALLMLLRSPYVLWPLGSLLYVLLGAVTARRVYWSVRKDGGDSCDRFAAGVASFVFWPLVWPACRIAAYVTAPEIKPKGDDSL